MVAECCKKFSSFNNYLVSSQRFHVDGRFHLLAVCRHHTDRLRDTRQQLLRSAVNSTFHVVDLFMIARHVIFVVVIVDPPIKLCVRRIGIGSVVGRSVVSSLELLNPFLMNSRSFVTFEIGARLEALVAQRAVVWSFT